MAISATAIATSTSTIPYRSAGSLCGPGMLAVEWGPPPRVMTTPAGLVVGGVLVEDVDTQ
ncbi:MAG TPA: hypothetical protein VFH58_06135 [Acidimicrobiales bacterium]|nr:hypothetical protein [Acidimicrobiales bacterium]